MCIQVASQLVPFTQLGFNTTAFGCTTYSTNTSVKRSCLEKFEVGHCEYWKLPGKPVASSHLPFIACAVFANRMRKVLSARCRIQMDVVLTAPSSYTGARQPAGSVEPRSRTNRPITAASSTYAVMMAAPRPPLDSGVIPISSPCSLLPPPLVEHSFRRLLIVLGRRWD